MLRFKFLNFKVLEIMNFELSPVYAVSCRVNTHYHLMQVKSIAEKCCKGSISAILLTFIRLPFVIKIFVLFIFERPFYIGFTVCLQNINNFKCKLMSVDVLKINQRSYYNLLNSGFGVYIGWHQSAECI